MRANSSLSKHPSSAAHRPLPGPPRRRAGSREPIRYQGNLRGQRASAVAAVARASGSPGAKPLRNPLSLPEGKVAPPSLGGLSRNTQPSSRTLGTQDSRLQDAADGTPSHVHVCLLFVPSLEYKLPNSQTSFLNFQVVSSASGT